MRSDLAAAVDGNIIEIHISGLLTTEVYKKLSTLMDTAIPKQRRVRILLVSHNFQGWDANSLIEGEPTDGLEFSNVERVAVVRDKIWNDAMKFFCLPFTDAIAKYFEHAELEHAIDWIRR